MPWFKKSDAAPKPVNWKTNLAALWLSQFLSLIGFYLCVPFLPLYIKQILEGTGKDVALWSGIFMSSAPATMIVMAPVWGMVGDRYGRKMMLIRASVAGAFVLYMMGVVGTIEGLIFLRVLQGCFTGTIPSAQALVVTNTPENKQGFAMGVLMAAVNSGNAAGPILGGLIASYYSPVIAFKTGGLILVLSTLSVVLAVRENFTPPVRLSRNTTRSARMRMRRDTITSVKMAIPVMVAVAFIAFLQTYDSPILSLYIDELYRFGLVRDGILDMGEETIISNVYWVTGVISSIVTILATAGSIGVGMLMDRKIPLWSWWLMAAFTGVGVMWICVDATMFSLTAGRALFFFFASGLGSALLVILSRMTPSSKRGAAIGWAMSARSIGWTIAPMVGALTAKSVGYSDAFYVLLIISALLVPTFVYLVRRYKPAFQPDPEDPPSIEAIEKGQTAQPSGQGKV